MRTLIFFVALLMLASGAFAIENTTFSFIDAQGNTLVSERVRVYHNAVLFDEAHTNESGSASFLLIKGEYTLRVSGFEFVRFIEEGNSYAIRVPVGAGRRVLGIDINLFLFSRYPFIVRVGMGIALFGLIALFVFIVRRGYAGMRERGYSRIPALAFFFVHFALALTTFRIVEKAYGKREAEEDKSVEEFKPVFKKKRY
ncbi:hypothetical protein COT72_02440 [archaeon CG10_big_fil_rev_8_21_14_0_10_43_11]|nr:MAG: hypothetical protein COT72_02440 [archaeon CG10_big_fil_rev_8_21_14_0_10_43_11]